MASERHTVPNLRAILLLASVEVNAVARMELADTGPLRVKAVSTVKEALEAIPAARPHALVIEQGLAQAKHILAARQLAELATSRKVPVVMFGGPLPEALEAQREELGIRDVIDGEYRLAPVLGALRVAITWADERRRTDQARHNLERISQRSKPANPDQ